LPPQASGGKGKKRHGQKGGQTLSSELQRALEGGSPKRTLTREKKKGEGGTRGSHDGNGGKRLGT